MSVREAYGASGALQKLGLQWLSGPCSGSPSSGSLDSSKRSPYLPTVSWPSVLQTLSLPSALPRSGRHSRGQEAPWTSVLAKGVEFGGPAPEARRRPGGQAEASGRSGEAPSGSWPSESPRVYVSVSAPWLPAGGVVVTCSRCCCCCSCFCTSACRLSLCFLDIRPNLTAEEGSGVSTGGKRTGQDGAAGTRV